MDIAVAISHLLIVFSCSANFIIYCRQDSKIRSIISNFLIKNFVCKRMNLVTSTQSSMQLLDMNVLKTDTAVQIHQKSSSL